MKTINNTIRYISDTEARVSKTFEKKAYIFGTEQYKLWKAYREDFPNAKMVTKSIKKNPNKKTYKNLTYVNMKIYIGAQAKNDKEKAKLLADFEQVQKTASIEDNPYRAVLAWFLNKYDQKKYQAFFAEKKEDEQKVEGENTEEASASEDAAEITEAEDEENELSMASNF